MSKRITFYDYVVDNVNSKEYDESLPFGGIRKDAPDKIKQQFDKFVKEYKSCIDKLIAEGENEIKAKVMVKEHFEFVKQEITKECSNSWKKHFKQNKKQR